MVEYPDVSEGRIALVRAQVNVTGDGGFLSEVATNAQLVQGSHTITLSQCLAHRHRELHQRDYVTESGLFAQLAFQGPTLPS